MADMTNRIFVGGLDQDVDEMELSRQFKAFGEIEQVLLMRDRETQKSRGFGFISFRDVASASDAIHRMHGVEMNGRPVSVRTAEREKGGFRGGFRGSFRGRGRGGFRGSRGGSSTNRYDDRDNKSDRRFGSSQSYDNSSRDNYRSDRGIQSKRDNYKSDFSSRSNSSYSGSNFRSNGRSNYKSEGSTYRSRSPAATRESAFYREESPVTRSFPRDSTPPLRRRSNDFLSSGRDFYSESKGRSSSKYSPPARHGQYRSSGRDDYSPPPDTKRNRYREVSNRSPSPVYEREYISTSFVPRSPTDHSIRKMSPPVRNISPSSRMRNLSPDLVRGLSPQRTHRHVSPPIRVLRTARNISPGLSPPTRKRNLSPSPPHAVRGHRSLVNLSPEYVSGMVAPVRERSREITSERVSTRTSRHATAGDSRSRGYAGTDSRMTGGRSSYRSPREISPVERKPTEGRYARNDQGRISRGRRY